MSLEAKTLKRVFKYGKLTLSDPDPIMEAKDVMQFYSGQYPELTNASLEGPSIENDEIMFEFGKTVGVKG
jgi:PRTRC genetic system protein C|tara:strand:+ start:335 stop:544 length:210 start_codon:yes stop_codon:yes gene_type:complete